MDLISLSSVTQKRKWSIKLWLHKGRICVIGLFRHVLFFRTH